MAIFSPSLSLEQTNSIQTYHSCKRYCGLANIPVLAHSLLVIGFPHHYFDKNQTSFNTIKSEEVTRLIEELRSAPKKLGLVFITSFIASQQQRSGPTKDKLNKKGHIVAKKQKSFFPLGNISRKSLKEILSIGWIHFCFLEPSWPSLARAAEASFSMFLR